MRVAIVGSGRMAQEMARVCVAERVEVAPLDALRFGDVAFHLGSGREVAQALSACARAGVPLIQGSTSIRLPAPLPVAVVDAPNLALVVVEVMQALQPLRGKVKAIRESHQASKRDVSATAKLLACRLEFPEERIESVRDKDRQMALGVAAAHLEGHAYHWIEFESEGVEVAVSIRVNGREPYARGGLALARHLAGRRLEPRVYTLDEVLSLAQTQE